MAGKGATLALKITGDASDARKALDDVEGRAGRFGGVMGKLGGGLAVFGGVAAAGLGAAAIGFGKLYQAADESRKIGALTEQVIKSTGGAAKISADQVGDLAGAIAAKTGVDDEAIQSAENLLLTFTNVQNGIGAGNDIFNQATKLATDMSVALGTDATTSAMQLGKALNDPIKGVGALSKVGVSFTEQQKNQIAAMVKVGDTAGAQKVILAELGKEFGGAAEAASTPMDRLQQRLGDVAEKLGGFLLPLVDQASAFLGDKLIPVVSSLADKIGPVLGPAIQQVGGFLTNTLIPAVMGLWNELGPKLVPIIQQVGGFITDVLVPAFMAVGDYVTSYVIPVFKAVLGPALEGVSGFFGKLKDAIEDNKGKFVEIYEKIKPFIEFMRDTVAPVVGTILKNAFDILGDAVGPVIDLITWILDKAADVLNFVGKVGSFLFGDGGGAASKPVGAPRGSAMFGAAAGGARLAGASLYSLSGGSVGPGSAGQGSTLGGTVVNITINGALDPIAVGRQVNDALTTWAQATGRQLAVTR